MAEHAHVVDDQIIDIRDIDLNSVPAHKRELWRPVVYEGRGDTKQTIVEADKVRVLLSMSGSLDDIKHAYRLRIEAEAEAIRMKYLTPGDGKALAYTEIKDESLAVGNDQTNPVAKSFDELDQEQKNTMEALYPLLSAEIPFRGNSYEAVATIVQTQYAAFRQIEKSVTRTLNQAKASIAEATTVEQVESAYASINWAV